MYCFVVPDTDLSMSEKIKKFGEIKDLNQQTEQHDSDQRHVKLEVSGTDT